MRISNGWALCRRPLSKGIAAALTAAVLVSCGGGTGGASPSDVTAAAPDPTILTGRFFDAAVGRLDYRTPTLSGTTDAEGRYNYREGEPVEFLIGNQSIGVAKGASLVRVYDVVAPGFSTATAESSLRVAQLLQSVDADSDPSNGISIIDAAKSWFSQVKLDFNATNADFAAAFKTATAGSGRSLVSEAQAQAHLDSGAANVAADVDAACGVPGQKLTLNSLRNQAPTVIDTAQATINCNARAQILGFQSVIQPTMRAELDMLNAQASIFADLADNSALVTEKAKRDALVGRVITAFSVSLDTAAELGDLTGEKNAKVLALKTAAATAKLAVKAVEVFYQPTDWQSPQQAELMAQLAQAVIDTMSNSAQCQALRKSEKRDDACTAAVFSALKIVSPTLGFAKLDNEKAAQALALLNVAINYAQSLTSAQGKPERVLAAHQQAAVDGLKAVSTLIAIGATTDGSVARGLWTGGIDTVADVADTYLACKPAASDLSALKDCKDALEKSFVDKTAGLALNTSLLLDFTVIDSKTQSLLLADRLVRDYLATGGSLTRWYAAYGLTDDSAKFFCWQILSSCGADQLTRERFMFDKVVAALVAREGSATWGSSPPSNATWQRFQAARAQLSALAPFYAGAQSLQLTSSADIAARTVAVTVKGLPSKIDSIQCTAIGATPETVTFATGQGGTASLAYAASGTYSMTCTGLKSAVKVVTRSLSWALGVCAADEVFTKGQCQRFVAGAPVVKSFSDDFNATVLNTLSWTAATGVPGHATEVTPTGTTLFASDFGGVDTKGKRHFSGGKIVVEGRAWGPGIGRGTAFMLIDVATGEGISISDTTYYGWGFNANGNGAYNFVEVERPLGVGAAPQNCTALGGSTPAPMEYRMTLVGNRITFERGPTLSNITQSATRTLGRSISGRTFYLNLGTGDRSYTPAHFDWVRVTVD